MKLRKSLVLIGVFRCQPLYCTKQCAGQCGAPTGVNETTGSRVQV